ncbi:MAG: hypothetical protein Tsb005_21230 [Gammaproteobacteria bacterium]
MIDKYINKAIDAICIFGGTEAGFSEEYVTVASKIGKLIGKKGIKLVFGGGSTGIMGAVATAVAEAGSEVIGIIPRCMTQGENATKNISQVIIAGSMHERRLKMYGLSDAFIVLPGGLGTLEETIEVLSWINLKIIKMKPLILIDINNYWEPLKQILNHMVKNGFIKASVLELITMVNDPSNIFRKLEENINRMFDENKTELPELEQELEEAYLNLSSHACAYELQRLAGKTGFDWADEAEALKKFHEEVAELTNEITNNKEDNYRLVEEYGDVTFALMNLARHLNIDYEHALNFANEKFKRRFIKMKSLIVKNNYSMDSMPLKDILDFWDSVKEMEVEKA